jgi:hypothetical protein
MATAPPIATTSSVPPTTHGTMIKSGTELCPQLSVVLIKRL